MFAVFVLKEVVYPLLLHESADKIKVCLTILHAIRPRTIAAAEGALKIREPVIAKDLFNNIRDCHFLKDATIRGSCQKPQPGYYGGPVACQPACR